MKIIVPLVRYYNAYLQSEEGNVVKKSFNENEKLIFQAIVSGDVNSDVHASKLLYDGNPSSQTYMKFKKAFYTKLVKMVVNFEIKNVNTKIDKKLHLLREFHALRIITHLSSPKLSLSLLKKVLLKAERLAAYDIAATCAQTIATSVKIHYKKVKEGDFYWDKYLYYKKLEDDRMIARNMYADIIKFTHKKHYNEELALKAEKAADFLEGLLDKENARGHISFFQLRYLQYILVSDHENVIKNNLEGLKYFDQFDSSIAGKPTLKIQLAVSYFNLNQYDQAVKYLEKNMSPTNKRWVLNVSLVARAMFLKDKYEEASVYLGQIVSNVTFKLSRPLFQERVWLLKYYADLMIGVKTGQSINTRQIKNNLTRIRTDKKAMNIPFFFAELIQDMLKNGIDSLYKNRDKLEIYYNSHIVKSKNKRATLFARFLRILPDSHYDKVNFSKKLIRIKDGLLKNPIEDVIQPDNEIVNYEILIASLLDQFAPHINNVFNNINERSLHIKEAVMQNA